MALTPFEAVIFDLDGVLIDSEPAHYAAEIELLAPYDFEFTEEIWHGLKGLTDGRFFERLRELGLAAPETDTELARRKLDILLRILPERARAFPAARDTVQAVADRRIALATSSARPLADAALRLLGLDDAFEIIVTGDDVGRGKPDPEPFLVTAERLGVPPRRCVVIEDSIHGVDSAIAAGAACIAVEHSFPAAELRRAHQTIPTVAEVPAAVRALEAHEWHEVR